MKSKVPPKKRVLKLRVEKEIRFRLLGISSHENDYRLVWAINNLLKMHFIRSENLVVHRPKQEAGLEFSRYTSRDENKYLTYTLISNRCPDGYLFAEIRNLDFILQIVGEISETGIRQIMQKLKGEAIISAIFILDPLKLKGVSQVFPE